MGKELNKEVLRRRNKWEVKAGALNILGPLPLQGKDPKNEQQPQLQILIYVW